MLSLQNKTFILIVFLVASIVGNCVFFLLWQNGNREFSQSTVLIEKYPFVARRVLLTGWNNDVINSFLPLRSKLHQEIDPYADSFAMYFEYLPTGVSIGIHEDIEFTAASLLKVPVVMAYYYKKERLGIKEDETVKIKKKSLNDRFGDLYKKGEGAAINLKEAVKLTLQKSDNTASLVIADQISDDDFRYVYEGLDIPLALEGDSPIITAQQYISVFKSLYFASILNLDDSQEILRLLTHTEFNNMLPKGVPKDIPVSHKIGLIDDEIYQDCGIVFVPNRPYALCMISKSDKPTAQKRMYTISKLIYKYLSEYNNN